MKIFFHIMYIIIFIIYKKKQLIEEISNEINSDIDLILKTYNEEKKNEDLAVQGKFKVLFTRGGKNKRCLLLYLYNI